MLNLNIVNIIIKLNDGRTIMVINGLPIFADKPYLNMYGLTGRIFGNVYLPNHDIGDPNEWKILGNINEIFSEEEVIETSEKINALNFHLEHNSLILIKINS